MAMIETSDRYENLLLAASRLREQVLLAAPDVRERPGCTGFSEGALQRAWLEQRFDGESLRTDTGRSVRVLSPGWWNRSEGPDFLGAQLEIDGRPRTGDIEIHLAHGAWKQHGHHLDPRYDEVLAEVVLSVEAPRDPPRTSAGRRIPCLLLAPSLLDSEVLHGEEVPADIRGPEVLQPGACAEHAQESGPEAILDFLAFAGEWRLRNKAAEIQQRMERAGPDQAIYESLLAACGYASYSGDFTTLAKQLPYERLRQLALRDSLLAEAALLQVSGLLPSSLAPGLEPPPHLRRLWALRDGELPGLGRLPLVWKRASVRPANYPERRLAGAARFLARTARDGLHATLQRIWRVPGGPLERRRAFERLFPRPLGFWATHYSWAGRELTRALAPLGAGRIRAIIGNVFVSSALADARLRRDLEAEREVFVFFTSLPKEPANRLHRVMTPRLFGAISARLDFRAQQGLLQVHADWCLPNPSCRDCPVTAFLKREIPQKLSP